MTRRLAPLLAALAALWLTGCAATQRLSAAGDVHTLLVAIRDDDRAAFEAHVDRKALEAQLKARIVDRAAQANVGGGWKGLGVLLSGPLAHAAGDLLIQPGVFRAVAEYYGYRPDIPIPSSLALATALKALPDGRVCAKGGGSGGCLLVFANESGAWRLVAFDGDAAMLRLKAR